MILVTALGPLVATLLIGTSTFVAVALVGRCALLGRRCVWLMRMSLAVVTGVVGVVVLASPSAAHTELVSLDPAEGARLDQVPRRLTLEFSEAMDPELSTVTLRVDGGSPTTLDVVSGRSPSTLVASVPPSLAADPGTGSRWRAAFRVVSSDGHPVAGESSFTVRATDTTPPGGTVSEGALETPESSDEEPSGEGQASEPAQARGFRWAPAAIGASVLALVLLSVLAIARLIRRDDDG